MKKYVSIIFIGLLSILVACQPGTKSKSKNSAEKKISAIVQLSPFQSATDIYSSSSSASLQKVDSVTQNPSTISVPVGTWKFLAISKSPSDTYCQQIYCGTSDQTTLQKDKQEVAITTSQSKCFENTFTNIIKSSCPAPPAPTAITLISPTSASNTVTKPTIKVSGLLTGATAHLYSDASCLTKIGSGSTTATSTSQNITLSSALAVGTHTFYAKQSNARGEYSSCSTAKLSYTVLSSAIAIFNLQDFSTSAKIYSYNLDDEVPQVNYLATTTTSSIALPVAQGKYMFFVVQHPEGDTYCQNVKCDWWDHTITTGTNTIQTFQLAPGYCSTDFIENYYKTYCTAPLPPTSATLSYPSTATDYSPEIRIDTMHSLANSGTLLISRDSACSITAGESSLTGTKTQTWVENLPGGTHRFYAKIKNPFNQSSTCAGPLLSYTALPYIEFTDSTQPFPTLKINNLAGGETISVRANTSTCTSGTIIDEFSTTGTGTYSKKIPWSAVLAPEKDYAIEIKQGSNKYCLIETLDVSQSLLEGIEEIYTDSVNTWFLKNRKLYYIQSSTYPYSNVGQIYPSLYYSNTDFHSIQSEYTLTSTGQLYNYYSGETVSEVSGRRFSHFDSFYGNSSCGTETNGQTICWGWNYYGQLGNGTATDTYVSTPQVVSGLPTRAKSFALNYNSSCALLYDGRIYCWGYDGQGELGTGNWLDSYTPTLTYAPGKLYEQIIPLASAHCAKTIDGSVDCWGNNSYGHLGLGDYSSRGIPTSIASLNGLVSSISASPNGATACAVLFTGELFCWGSNNQGSLGLDLVPSFPTPTLVSSPLDQVTKAFPSDEGICYQTDFARVKCLGNQSYSRLGDALIPASATPTMSNRYDQSSDPIIKLFSAPNHSATLYKTQSGKVYLQGGVTDGVLTYDRINPTISGQTLNSAGTGYNVYTVLTNSGALYSGTTSLSPVTQLGAAIKEAPYFTSWGGCVLYTNGSVKCWGSYDGVGGTGTLNAPSTIFTSGIIQIAGNDDTHFAVTSAGELYGWGYNGNKELGDGTTTTRPTPRQLFASGITAISSSNYSSCALNSNKEVLCWGWSISSMPLLISTLPKTATKVQMSQSGACSLHSDGSVYCWGDNSYGQLGQGGNYFYSSWSSAAKKVPLALPAIDISKGVNHACALLNNNKLFCWGSNVNGELGIETWRNTPHYMLKNPNE